MAKRKRIGANQRLEKTKKRQRASRKKPGTLRRIATVVKVVCLLASLTVLGVIGAQKAAVHINTVEFLNVKHVLIQGVEQIDTAEVLSLAAVEPGISMINLGVSDIRRRLLKNPWIAKAQVRRRIPHTVVITVVERKPVALVNRGAVYMVDQTGLLWPLRSHAYWNLPVMSGLTDTIVNGDHRLSEDGLMRMNTFLDDINSSDKNYTLGISQIDFSDREIICVKLESSPVQVILGSHSIVKGLDDLRKILETVKENSERMPRHINLCYNNIAFVR